MKIYHYAYSLRIMAAFEMVFNSKEEYYPLPKTEADFNLIVAPYLNKSWWFLGICHQGTRISRAIHTYDEYLAELQGLDINCKVDEHLERLLFS